MINGHPGPLVNNYNGACYKLSVENDKTYLLRQLRDALNGELALNRLRSTLSL
ncbi:unnamed protein product [Brassica oleracea var. botrytis]|uniref:Uncharacterized protein n=2 Tax=Brassica TaxID=3705 RepID=A0A3P6ACC4_BRAOL|nr:unnamed protein product [Brassica napus]CDY14493.1 BnaC03g21020D [Brassica napus]VDC89487.1 unnamed protein product [Brassica oleracea]